MPSREHRGRPQNYPCRTAVEPIFPVCQLLEERRSVAGGESVVGFVLGDFLRYGNPLGVLGLVRNRDAIRFVTVWFPREFAAIDRRRGDERQEIVLVVGAVLTARPGDTLYRFAREVLSERGRVARCLGESEWWTVGTRCALAQ